MRKFDNWNTVTSAGTYAKKGNDILSLLSLTSSTADKNNIKTTPV